MRFVKKKEQSEESAASKYNSRKALLDTDGFITLLTLPEVKMLKEKGLKEGQLLFDSGLEARYYRDQLLPMVKDQSILVEFQPKYTLVPKFEKEGIKHMAVTYTPDFKVTYFSGKVLLIDVKGAEDQKFPIKRKLFDYINRDLPPLLVMKYCKKFGGWITIEEYNLKKREEKKANKA